jgi:septal ring factor EnvC (AmiA/AmiB activator)
MRTKQVTEPDLSFKQFMASMRKLRKNQEETAQQLKETKKLVQEISRQIKETGRTDEKDRQAGGRNYRPFWRDG